MTPWSFPHQYSSIWIWSLPHSHDWSFYVQFSIRKYCVSCVNKVVGEVQMIILICCHSGIISSRLWRQIIICLYRQILSPWKWSPCSISPLSLMAFLFLNIFVIQNGTHFVWNLKNLLISKARDYDTTCRHLLKIKVQGNICFLHHSSIMMKTIRKQATSAILYSLCRL